MSANVALTSIGNVLVDPTVSQTVDSAEAAYVEQACDASNGNYVVNDGDTVLVFRNSDAGDQTVVFDTQTLDNMGTLVNPGAGTKTITIPDAGSAVVGPFDPTIFGVEKATRSVQGGAGTVADVTKVRFKASSANVLVYAVKVVGRGVLTASTDV